MIYRKIIILLLTGVSACLSSYGQAMETISHGFTDNSTINRSESTSKGYLFRNIYAEFFGPSNIFGISFDSRFSPGTPLGYRVGLSMGIGGSIFHFDSNKNRFAIGIPIEVNGIFGKQNSKFEVGLGANIGLLTRRWDKVIVENAINDNSNPYHTDKSIRSYFYYYMFGNIGYRLQKENGFMFRVGITPTFVFDGTKHLRLSPFVMPYVSFGYTL